MSNRSRNILEALERINFFADANPELKSEVPITVELFDFNRAVITRFRAAGITRESSTSLGRNETLTKSAVSERIYTVLREIAQTADILESRNPAFENTYTLPRDRMSYAQLLDKARAIYADSAAAETDFLAFGLAPNFRAALLSDIEALEAVTQSQADAKRSKVGANADALAASKDGMKNRKTLDRALKNHYRLDPVKLAEWRTACRVKNSSQKSGDEEEQSPESSPTPPNV